MGRQALTSKESELARSPSKSVKAPSPHGNPQGIPREPAIFPGILRRQLKKPLCWDLGPDSLEGLPLKMKISQNDPKLHQNAPQ